MNKSIKVKAPISSKVKKLINKGFAHELVIKAVINKTFEVNRVRFSKGT